MKPASISELKKELQTLPPARLMEVCLRLAKFKNDNKELLSYLLFEEGDLQGYIAAVKLEMDEAFAAQPKTNLYYVKKYLRKILRGVSKQIKYTGSKVAEIELLLYFLVKIKKAGIKVGESPALTTIYLGQIKKIKKAIESQHEDLQYEYTKELEKL